MVGRADMRKGMNGLALQVQRNHPARAMMVDCQAATAEISIPP
jgi:hypothetical protein